MDPAVSSNATSCSSNSGRTVKCSQAGHPGGSCQIIQTISGGNPSSCCNSCSATAGCNFWVFNVQYNSCYLKQGSSSYQASDPSCTWGAPAPPAPPPPPPRPPPPPPPPAPSPTPGCSSNSGRTVKCNQAGHPGGSCQII